MVSVWLGKKSGDKCIKKRSLHAEKETERAEVCVCVCASAFQIRSYKCLQGEELCIKMPRCG